MTTHRCPKQGCTAEVPDRLFACAPHWFQLSPATREAISSTAKLNLLDPARRAAFQDARDDWQGPS